MFRRYVTCLAGTSWRSVIGVMTVMVLLGSMGVVSSAAVAKEPTGDFAVFKRCPRFTTGVNLCLYSQITGGEMILDKLVVPIVNPVTFQGGIKLEEPSFAETFVSALGEETLSPTPQPVTGGLSSLIDCNEINGRRFLRRVWRKTCRAMFENSRFTTVNATTELVGAVGEINKSNELAREGISLTLPVRVHLENPLLGKECYIGSSMDPIVFSFTTGTTSPPLPNKPIEGRFGTVSFKDNFEIAVLTDHVQVDNTFSAPEATGCGGRLAFLINPLINSKVGLPSPAGYNTIIHSGTANEATTVGVIASEPESQPGEPESEQEEGHFGERPHERPGHGKGPGRWRH
jgi:hypothetical protein